jgi:hypothetical protein
MTRTTDPILSPLDTIPDPERIRDRLSVLFAEARLLRRLLRLSQATQHERSAELNDRQEACHAE